MCFAAIANWAVRRALVLHFDRSLNVRFSKMTKIRSFTKGSVNYQMNRNIVFIASMNNLCRNRSRAETSSVREPVIVPARDPVMVPAREPVIVPARDPVIVPAFEPVMVPERVAREPVMVPAETVQETTKVRTVAKSVDFRTFIFFLLVNTVVYWDVSWIGAVTLEVRLQSGQLCKYLTYAPS